MAPFQSTDPGSNPLGGLLPALQATGGPRSLMVAIGTVVLGSIAWFSMNHYASNPWLFGSLTVGCTVLIGLLLAQGLGVFGKTRQAEPAPVNLLAIRQSGMFYATGAPSATDLEPLVRQCLGIHDLPAPAALVKGEARDKANWQELTPTEAAKIAELDQSAVAEKLKEIIAVFAGGVAGKNLVGAPQKPFTESASEPASESSKENAGK